MDNETPGTDVSEESKYYAVCDYCSFSLPCQPGYDIVKKACDEHNEKNPGHDAAPINC